MENSAANVSLLEMPELAELIASTPVVKHAAGEALFKSGDLCMTLPLVVSGSARIYTQDNNSRRVTLYCLKPGDICTTSLSILLQRSTYPATAIAETTTLVRYLSGENMTATINRTPEVFRAFLNTLAGGLYESACTARHLINHADDNPSGVPAEHSV